MILKDQFLYDFNKTIYSKMITESPGHVENLIFLQHDMSQSFSAL